MNASQRATDLRNKFDAKGYPFLGAELLLEIGSLDTWPLVQVWDDALQSLILIAVVDQDRHIWDALVYARVIANQSEFGDITICYALGHHAWASEFDESPSVSYIMREAL